jgi:hypothetical protein
VMTYADAAYTARGMTAVAAEPVAPQRPRVWPGWVYPALAGLLGLAAVVVLWAGRGTSFLGDEWAWILGALHPRVGTFLDPYNGHLIASTRAFFTVIPRVVGLGDYVPYRVCALALHLLIAVEVFVLARRRLTDAQALLPAALIALLGTGADAFLTAINVDELAAIASGLGALALLDRDTRRADLGACALLIVALMSWTSAVALAAGALVELLLCGRPGLRRVWVVLVPALLYAGWRIHWAGGLFAHVGVSATPTPGPVTIIGHALQAATGAAAGLVGVQLTSPTLNAHLPWLDTAAEVVVAASAVVAVSGGLVARRRRRGPGLTPRFAGLVVNGMVLWLLLGVARGSLGDLYASRYVYVGAVVVALAAVEVGACLQLGARALRVIGAIAGLSLALNIGWMIVWSNHLRDEATRSRAELAALEIAGPRTPASFAPSSEFALAAVRAGSYFAGLQKFGGSPAGSLAALSRAPESAREAADQVLVRATAPHITPGGTPKATSTPPRADAAVNVNIRSHGPCLATSAISGVAWLTLTLRPASRLVISVGNGAGLILLARRFADRFGAVLGGAAAGARVTMTVPPSGAPMTWRVKAFERGQVTFCPLLFGAAGRRSGPIIGPCFVALPRTRRRRDGSPHCHSTDVLQSAARASLASAPR